MTAVPQWAELALSQQGKPYIWGSGSGAGGRGRGDIDPQSGQPRGYDCSGFVSWVLKQAAGIDLPAYTGTAYPATRALGPGEQPRPGDVVFYNMNTPDPRRQHIALYLGDDKIVQSGGRGNNVNVDDVNAVGRPEYRRVVTNSPEQERLLYDPAYAPYNAAGQSAGVQNQGATGGSTPIDVGVSKAWGAAAPYAGLLLQAGAAHGVPVNLLAGLLIQESGGNPGAISRAGAQGLMQFMPDTARGMGIDPFDAAQAIDGGARYLKQLADMRGGDWQWAIGAYNAGPAGNQNNRETRNHIQKVMGFADGIGEAMMQIPPPGGPFGGPPGPPGLPPPPGGGGGDRDRDRQGPGVPPQVQTGISYLLDYARRLQEQAGGMVPQGPAGRAYNGPTNQVGQPGAAPGMVSIPVADIQAAISGNNQELLDFLRSMALGAASVTPLGGGTEAMIRGAAGNAAQRGGELRANPPGLPGLPSLPGLPGGPGGPGAPGGGPSRSTDMPFGGEVMGPPGPPAAGEKPKPPGWTDPNRYQGTHRGIVEQANALAQEIADAQEILAKNPGDPDALDRLSNAQARLVQMSPTLQQIEREAAGQQEGTVLPGTTPYQRNISVIRKNPQTGQYEVVSVPNPNAEENPSITTANIAAGSSRYASDVAAGSSRYASDVSRENALTGAAAQLGVAGIGAQSAANVANIGSATQRATSALSAAVEQQRTRIDAMIRSGQLKAEDGYRRFDAWYKQNVEAPLAILEQQRQTEQFKIQGQEAITRRASGQAEHERGLAQIGTQMFGNATNAYTAALDRSAPAGWGAAFQRNLQTGGNEQLPSEMNVPSLEDFARSQVAWILKDVSPYAASVAAAQSQIGNPGQAMGGDQMTGLTEQATGVASNALANPYQLPPLELPQLPAPINPSQYVGQPTGTQPLQLPDFSMPGAGYGRG